MIPDFETAIRMVRMDIDGLKAVIMTYEDIQRMTGSSLTKAECEGRLKVYRFWLQQSFLLLATMTGKTIDEIKAEPSGPYELEATHKIMETSSRNMVQ